MKQVISLFVISALVLLASAELNNKAVTDLLTGFTNGLNYPELNPSFDNCSFFLNQTKQYAFDAVAAGEQGDTEAFADAVSSFGFSFAQAIRSCGKAVRLVRVLLETIGSEIRNISQDSISTRLFTNLVDFNMKFSTLKTSFSSRNYLATGETLAEIFKLFVSDSIETSTLRQLDQFAAILDGSLQVAAGLDSVFLSVQGFIEVANTTIVVDHYSAFVNDSSYILSRFPVLEAEIEAGNFPAVIAIATDIYKLIGNVTNEYTIVKNETIAFIQRDLPLFESEENIAKAVESLFLDLPNTITNLNRIINAYKKQDYRDFGHGLGGIYNQFRNSIIGN